MRTILLLALLATACAPTLVRGTMTNPAKTTSQIQSTQEYDIGPYKENHRYTVSITRWSPTAIGAQIKVVDDARCGDTRNYSFTLVDDKGARFPFAPEHEPVHATERGRGDVALTSSTVDGQFAAPIGAATTSLTVELRPQPGIDCPSLDFHWDLS